MKKKSVCLLIRNREYSDQNNRRRDFKILKSLICYVSQIPLQILKSGDWGCVAAVERLPALHYSVDFIFLFFGIMGFIISLWNFETIRGSLMRPKF